MGRFSYQSFKLDRHAWTALFFLSEMRTRKALCSGEEKPVCITKRPASNSIQFTDVYDCGPRVPARIFFVILFPLASSRRLIPSRFFLESAAKNITNRPDALLSRGFVHRAGSPFFQILHILSAFRHMPLSIFKQSPRRVAQRCLFSLYL